LGSDINHLWRVQFNMHFPRIRRAAGASLLAVAALTLTAGTALGHECMNESRSAKGDARAAESGAWTFASNVALEFILPEVLGVDPLTPEQLAEAQAIVAAEKASGDFDDVYAEDRAILTRSTAMNGNSRDGFTPKSDDERAIDHVTADLAELDALLGHLVEIYIAVSS
jgi:hypothetical protein